MKNKKLVIANIILIIVIICALLETIFFIPNTNELMRFAIYPSDKLDDPSYYFVLYDDATLVCFIGEIAICDDIQTDKFLEIIYRRAKKKLQQNEFTGLISLADERIASNFIDLDCSCSGWYYVTLLYDGKVYMEIYQYNKILQSFQEEILQPYPSNALERLSEEITRLSPLKIEIEDFDTLIE